MALLLSFQDLRYVKYAKIALPKRRLANHYLFSQHYPNQTKKAFFKKLIFLKIQVFQVSLSVPLNIQSDMIDL